MEPVHQCTDSAPSISRVQHIDDAFQKHMPNICLTSSRCSVRLVCDWCSKFGCNSTGAWPSMCVGAYTTSLIHVINTHVLSGARPVEETITYKN
jgi:hypothetical protein